MEDLQRIAVEQAIAEIFETLDARHATTANLLLPEEVFQLGSRPTDLLKEMERTQREFNLLPNKDGREERTITGATDVLAEMESFCTISLTSRAVVEALAGLLEDGRREESLVANAAIERRRNGLSQTSRTIDREAPANEFSQFLEDISKAVEHQRPLSNGTVEKLCTAVQGLSSSNFPLLQQSICVSLRVAEGSTAVANVRDTFAFVLPHFEKEKETIRSSCVVTIVIQSGGEMEGDNENEEERSEGKSEWTNSDLLAKKRTKTLYLFDAKVNVFGKVL